MNIKTTKVKSKYLSAAFKNLMFLHWIMAAFLLLLYVTGIFVARIPQASSLARLIPFLHQSWGMLFMMLLIARIFLLLRLVGRKYSKRLPKVTSHWLQTFVFHTALYLFMLVAPISGFFLRNLKGLDTTFFGILVPPVFAANESWVELVRSSHFWSSYLFLAFIFLHILAHWKVIRGYVRRYSLQSARRSEQI